MNPSVFEFENYRFFLKELLESRKSKNSNYSLRAFSRDLDMVPGRLSNIINNRYGMSVKAARVVSNKLFPTISEKHYFCKLVEFESTDDVETQKKVKDDLKYLKKYGENNLLSRETVEYISTYHHMALLELTYLRSYRYDLNWIAEKLKVDVDGLKQIISNLKEAKLIEDRDDDIVPVSEYSYTESDIVNKIHRNHHFDLLNKADRCLREVDVLEREFRYLIMSFDSSRMGEVKEFMRTMMKEFDKRFAQDINRDCVYNFSANFFPLIK